MNTNFYIDNDTGFLAYSTTEEDVKLAESIFEQEFSTSLNLNGKTVYAKKESRMAGILGEVVFEKFANTYFDTPCIKSERGAVQYDFLFDNQRIDVKTKFRSVVPKQDFEASFFMYQSVFTNVDMYAFLSTITNYKTVWFCGYLPKKQWIENSHGRIWKAGETDPTNGKVFHSDTYSVQYKYLYSFVDILP